MAKFSNSYWSSDYKSGIDSLNKQSSRSIQQLHEFHQLVFNYMNYINKNSESLHKICVESYPYESAFRPYNPNAKVTLASPRNTLKRISDSFRALNLNTNVASGNTPSALEIPEKQNGVTTMNTSYESYIANLNKQSQSMSSLAILIDREILEKISVFIKTYEPQLRSIMDEFLRLYGNYEDVLTVLEKLKVDYDELIYMYSNVNAADKNNEQLEKLPEKELPEIPQESDESSFDSESAEIKESEQQSTVQTDDKDSFHFPTLFGPLRISDYQELSKLLKKLVPSMKTTKRRLHIIGYKDDIFSSDQLTEYLNKFRPFNFNPTRLNIERFGQSLLDFKIIVNSNFFATAKFKSEGMWFEWSDLAIRISQYEEDESPNAETTPTPPSVKQTKVESPSKDSQYSPRRSNTDSLSGTPSIGVTPAFMSDLSTNTSKMFQSVKSSLQNKTNYSAKLAVIEEEYKENYLLLQDLQNLINTTISSNAEFLEGFEVAKINLFYTKLSDLAELSYNHQLQFTNNLHTFTASFIENINTQSSQENDIEQLLANFSTGIYFPSSSSTLLHFQNLKNQFNLYKDFQLQVKLGGDLLTYTSIPLFVYQLMEVVSAGNSLAESWVAPISHQEYWDSKQEIIKVINNYETFEIAQESSIHSAILNEIEKYFQSISSAKGVNFLKNWLLEISDSLIPCMIYDSIVNLYKSTGNADPMSLDNDARKNELTRLLGTIPRSNLSTLVFILEHIAATFELTKLPGYGLNDDTPDEVKEESQKISEVSEPLNSMDQIGAVPFVHYILRPSVLKNSTGFKPPLDIYKGLTIDLLNVEVRGKLLKILLVHEGNFKIKKDKQTETFKLQVKKLPQLVSPPATKPVDTTIDSSTSSPGVMAPLPRINGVTPSLAPPENFTLRPFRTKATPNPSPSTSPQHTPSNSVDLSNEKLRRSKDTTHLGPPPTRDSLAGGRPRSGSSSLLSSGIAVEFAD